MAKKDRVQKGQWAQWIDDQIETHPVIANKHKRWALVKNFYKGEQYKGFDEAKVEIKNVDKTRETRCAYNIVKMLLNLWGAKMLEGDPVPQSSPHGGNIEEDDIDVSRVANGLMSVWWANERLRKKLGQAIRWGAKTGIGIWKVYFDEDGGDGIDLNTALEGYDFDTEVGSIKPGTVRVEVVNPFHFYPDPVARCNEDLRWVIHRYPQSRALAEEQLGVPAGTFEADDKSELEMEIMNATNI